MSFTVNNEGFICISCGKEVPKHPTSSRDHCNFCLRSLHVDVEPGDRRENCKGIMEPKGIMIHDGQTDIYYECSKCSTVKKNIAAPDDNKDVLIELSAKPIKPTLFNRLSK